MARGDKTPETAGATPAPSQNPRFVRAVASGYYGQIRQPGEVFENTLDLPIKGSSWLEAADPKAATSDE